ncbi:MAG: hypothetical protein GY831_00455, partial [Delftia sp.]|nr:hypothetical protein [Delftia sp.]
MLQRRDLARLVLHRLTRIETRVPSSAAALLGWINLHHAAGPACKKRCAEWPGLWEELNSWVGGELGEPGELLFTAWGHGHGQDLLIPLLLFEPLLATWGSGCHGQGWLRGRLPVLAPGYHQQLLELVPRLGQDGVEHLLSAAEAKLMGQAIRAAEAAIGDDPTVVSAFAASRWLTTGLAARDRAFAAAIEELVAEPSPAAFATAAAALDQVKQHRREGPPEVRLYIARLAAYLVFRNDQTSSASPHEVAHLEAARLARAYRDHGGWVDLARQRLRGQADPVLGDAARAVLAAVDEL